MSFAKMFSQNEKQNKTLYTKRTLIVKLWRNGHIFRKKITDTVSHRNIGQSKYEIDSDFNYNET